MKALLAGILSVCVLVNSFSPALAGVNPKNLVKAGRSFFTVSAASTKKVLNGLYLQTRLQGAVSQIDQLDYRPLIQIENFAYSKWGTDIQDITLREKIQVYYDFSTPVPFSEERIYELLSDVKMSQVGTLIPAEKESFFLSTFPEYLLEKDFQPSLEQLDQAVGFYRNVLLQPATGTLDDWSKRMEAMCMLGISGTQKDILLILDTARSVRGVQEELTDIIASRALFNLGGDAAVQTLAEFRLSALDPKGNPAKLPYSWKSIADYAEQIGKPLEIKQGAISTAAPARGRGPAETMLQRNAPYGFMFSDSSVEFSEGFAQLRQMVEERKLYAQAQQLVQENISVKNISFPRSALQFNPKIHENLKRIAEAEEMPAPVQPVREEPGLHENTVKTVLEVVDVPQEEAGDLGLGERVVATGEAEGFKFTVEGDDNVEKILRNVEVTIAPSFKTEGYNRVAVFQDKFVLKNEKLESRDLQRFFIELNNENGELFQLLKRKPGYRLDKETRRVLRIKFQPASDKFQKAVSLPITLKGAPSVHAEARIDKRLLPKDVDLAKAKLVVHKDGKVYCVQPHKKAILLQKYLVRLPKLDRMSWLPLLQANPGQKFKLKIHPTSNKMGLLSRMLSMNMLGMGKTISPELEARTSFSETTASSIMFGINNCSPLLVGLLRKPLEKYGEATILRLGSLFFVGGGVMAMASGLLGHLGTGQMSALQLVGFLGSTLAIAAGTSIIRFAQNLAITANVGVLEEDIAEEEGKKLAQEDYTWKYLGERVKEVLTKKPESAAGAVHYYQVAQMFKNIGTFAFLGLPWAINALAGLAGYHPNLDFSISYVPYTILALLTTLRLRASAIKDSIPTRITSLENQHIETVTRATDKLSKLPLEKLKYDSKHVTKRVEKMCESANQLLKGYDRQKQAQIEEAKKKAKKAGKPYQEPVDPNAPKLSKKEAKAAAKAAKKKKAHEFIDNLAKESTESVFNALLKRGIPEEQALEASNEVKKAFDELNTYRETSIAETLRLPGIKAGALAITLATIHELSISNGFSFALRHLIPAGEAANAATALTLYGSLTVGRLLGNWLHRRVSDASMYAISSAASVAGTVGMIAAGSNVWALVAGAVVASFGVGNFFSQMYHYFTKLHGRQYERTISLIINYTMPAAAVLSSPMRAIVNWTGIPSIDLTISAVALGASLVLSSKMFAKSSLVRVLQNNVTSAKKGISSFGEKIKKFFSRGKKGPLPPADLDSATPAQ